MIEKLFSPPSFTYIIIIIIITTTTIIITTITTTTVTITTNTITIAVAVAIHAKVGKEKGGENSRVEVPRFEVGRVESGGMVLGEGQRAPAKRSGEALAQWLARCHVRVLCRNGYRYGHICYGMRCNCKLPHRGLGRAPAEIEFGAF